MYIFRNHYTRENPSIIIIIIMTREWHLQLILLKTEILKYSSLFGLHTTARTKLIKLTMLTESLIIDCWTEYPAESYKYYKLPTIVSRKVSEGKNNH